LCVLIARSIEQYYKYILNININFLFSAAAIGVPFTKSFL